MKIAASIFVVCFATFYLLLMMRDEGQQNPIWISLPGVLSFFGMVGSAAACVICMIWDVA